MVIGVCFDRNESSVTYGIKGKFVFSELSEMLASMHVICAPGHHNFRQKWWEKVRKELDADILERIQVLSDITNEWLVMMDFSIKSDFLEMDIEEILKELETLKFSEWVNVFEPYGKKITVSIKNQIIKVIKEYYEVFFKKELIILKPIIVRELQKQYEDVKIHGFEGFLRTIHERLKVENEELVFVKNREYRYKYSEIDTFIFEGSTFLSPHLIMDDRKENVLIMKHFYAEKDRNIPPIELAGIYNALGDTTRLMILKELGKRENTTKFLAKKLAISEAAVSKQLKMMFEAGLLKKRRKGNYIFYYIDFEKLDMLTYRAYEYLSE